jgi:hypothetical protein
MEQHFILDKDLNPDLGSFFLRFYGLGIKIVRMPKTKKVLAITSFLIFCSSVSAYASDCNPIGLFVGGADLKNQSVDLISTGPKHRVYKTQINTINCKSLKKTLPEEKYTLLQKYVAAGSSFLAIAYRTSPPSASYCLMDIMEDSKDRLKVTALKENDCGTSDFRPVKSSLLNYPLLHLDTNEVTRLLSPASKPEGKK